MTVPSLLFQETSSRVPRTNALACSDTLVRTRGEKALRSVIATSGNVVGELTMNAARLPSRLSEYAAVIVPSGAEILVTAPLTGSTRKRWDAVCWEAVK